MRYAIGEPVDPSRLADLRQAVGWNRMDASLRNPRLKNAFDLSCFDGNRLVGYVSAVSNGATDGYIQDLMVHPDHQRRGIGTELVRRAIEALRADGIYMISVIYGDAALRPFYEKFGFCTMLCGQLETRWEP